MLLSCGRAYKYSPAYMNSFGFEDNSALSLVTSNAHFINLLLYVCAVLTMDHF